MTKKQFMIGAVLIACLHIVLVIFFGIQKQGFHEDEYYTYWSVSSEDVSPENFTWHTGHELQRRFLVRDGEQFSIGMVARNQAEDVHPPLYYISLHILMSLFPDTFYKWFGILLNLAFSLVTYVGVLLLFLQLRKKEMPERYFLSLAGGAVYAVAPSTISCIMLTRMYAMSTMWTVLYALIFALLMNSSGYGRRRFGFLTFGGALICYCAFLTHYYALFVPFFLTLLYCVFTLLRRQRIVRMLIYGGCLLGAVGLAVLTYPVCINHIFKDYRGTGAIKGLMGDSLFGRAGVFLQWLDGSVFAGWLVPCLVVFAVFAVIGIILVLRNQETEERAFLTKLLLLEISCLLSFWMLTKVALMVGEAASRYFYPVIALFLPLMAYVVIAVCLALVNRLGQRTMGKLCRKALSFGVALIIVCVPVLHTYSQGKVLFLYQEDKEKVAFAEEYKEYPLVLVYNREVAYRAWYVDNQVWPFEKVLYADVEFMPLLEDATIAGADKVVVYMDAPEEYLQYIIDKNPNLSDYTLVRHDAFFRVYLLQ